MEKVDILYCSYVCDMKLLVALTSERQLFSSKLLLVSTYIHVDVRCIHSMELIQYICLSCIHARMVQSHTMLFIYTADACMCDV